MKEKTKYENDNTMKRPIYTLAGLVIICLAAILLCLALIYRLYLKLDKYIDAENEKIALLEDRLGMFEKQLEANTEYLMNMEDKLRSDITSTANRTRQVNNMLDAIYKNLQEPQKIEYSEAFYRIPDMEDEQKEALKAFKEGRYVTAHRLYRDIATAQPANQEARFYQYYSMFLNNPQDQDNYRSISEAFNLLEKHGYTRQEIVETLEFIETETAAKGEAE